MSNLYIFNFNSLINRIVKKYDTLAGYGTPKYTLKDTNFKDGNDLQTTHIVNYNGNGDYVVITDENDKIKTRWFIESKDVTRGNQIKLSLRRDALADYYNSVITSPMIIERAMLIKQNPLIFNPEGFTFNQIKKDEILLKDRLGCPWIIMYMAKNAESKTITLPSQSYTADIELNTTLENSIYAAGTKYSACFDTTFSIEYQNYDTARNNYYDYKISFDENSIYNPYLAYKDGTLVINTCDPNYFIQTLGNDLINNYGNFNTLLTNNLSLSLINDANIALLRKASEQQLVIKDTNNKYYKIQVIINQKNKTGYILDSYSLFTSLNGYITNAFSVRTAANGESYSYDTNVYEVETVVTDVSSIYGNEITLDPSTKFETMDSECNIIAIPYGDLLVENSFTLEDDTPIYHQASITKEAQLNIAQQFAQKYTNSAVYDMQLLPYCPIQSFIDVDSRLDVSGYTGDLKSYTKWTLQTGYVGIVFHLTSKQFTFDINRSLTIPSFTGDVNLDTKISNECDIVRLVSPNYNGIFEFSVAKNDGVNKFNVDVTLKPYNPYIHINPNFKNIYGSDYDDARGLICGGDFSLPITGDQFESYELQNKNYQIAFNRQIEHMDFEYSLQRQEAVFGAITGVVGGAVSGGTAGAAAGPYGALAGAVVGGVTSAVGGAIDYAYLTSRQAENKSLAIDNFKYQLGNIRALPYQLNKVNPFTINNKIYPFIELYSCTDEEKYILYNKIIYNSMNVNAIGSIQDYLQANRTFIKGSLIRFENSDGIANNIIEAISYELAKGVYI